MKVSCPAAPLSSSLLHQKGSPRASAGSTAAQLPKSLSWPVTAAALGQVESSRSRRGASLPHAAGMAGSTGAGGHSSAGLAPATTASLQTAKPLTARRAAQVSAPLAVLALPKSNFTSALFDDSSPNQQACRNRLNTEAPTLACTTELRLHDKLDNTVNSVCVLHIVSVTKQGSLVPYQPGEG